MAKSHCQKDIFHGVKALFRKTGTLNNTLLTLTGSTSGRVCAIIRPAKLILNAVKMSECWKFQVEGRVQGVWFRESTRRQAELLGLCGHAINCADGSVEVLACGEAEAIKVLSEWLQHGPPMAEVNSVAHVPFAGICPDRFTTG